MVAIIADRSLEDRLRAERERTGADRYDEVWEGVYVMNPLPDNEHQRLVHRFEMVFGELLERDGLGEVFRRVNLTDREDDWKSDFRGPDVAVFLKDTQAENLVTHWRGPADLLVEIVSRGDRTREKIAFYSRLGVRELLLVDRDPWSLELYRCQQGQLLLVGQSTEIDSAMLGSSIVPAEFRLGPGTGRPSIQVTHPPTGRHWSL